MAEGAPLLREYGVYSLIEGSNPSLSAILAVAVAVMGTVAVSCAYAGDASSGEDGYKKTLVIEPDDPAKPVVTIFTDDRSIKDLSEEQEAESPGQMTPYSTAEPEVIPYTDPEPESSEASMEETEEMEAMETMQGQGSDEDRMEMKGEEKPITSKTTKTPPTTYTTRTSTEPVAPPSQRLIWLGVGALVIAAVAAGVAIRRRKRILKRGLDQETEE